MKAENLDLHLFISDDIFSFKIYDKRDIFFHFEFVNLPFFISDVPCSTSYGVHPICLSI